MNKKTMFKNLSTTYAGSLNMHNLMVNWLDKDDNPVSPDVPNSCRAIGNIALYKDRNNIYMGSVFPANFKTCHNYLNLCLVVNTSKDGFLAGLFERLSFLNSIKNKFKTNEDLTITELNWEIPGLPHWKCYKLTGPRVWISSAPAASFVTGILKYGFKQQGNNNFLHPGQNDLEKSIEKFITQYCNSEYLTDDLGEIKREYNKNYDYVGHGFAYTFGCSHFLNNLKVQQALPKKLEVPTSKPVTTY